MPMHLELNHYCAQITVCLMSRDKFVNQMLIHLYIILEVQINMSIISVAPKTVLVTLLYRAYKLPITQLV